MRKTRRFTILSIGVALAFLLGILPVSAAKPTSFDANGHETAWVQTTCATIQSGTIEYSSNDYLSGEPLQVGFDPYGYNYQAHMFSGYYINAYLDSYGYPPYEGASTTYLTENPDFASALASAPEGWLATLWEYRNVKLTMKWNDAWLANTDCDGDHQLDRHLGFVSYIGSGAWETNQMSGTYTSQDGNSHAWDEFTKIVAVPSDATLTGGTWYASDGSEIGPNIWGQFAIIQDVYNDPYSGSGGVDILSSAAAGFGYYAP